MLFTDSAAPLRAVPARAPWRSQLYLTCRDRQDCCHQPMPTCPAAGNKRKLRVLAQPNVTLSMQHVPRHCRRARVALLGPLMPEDLNAASFVNHRPGKTCGTTCQKASMGCGGRVGLEQGGNSHDGYLCRLGGRCEECVNPKPQQKSGDDVAADRCRPGSWAQPCCMYRMAI